VVGTHDLNTAISATIAPFQPKHDQKQICHRRGASLATRRMLAHVTAWLR
jgi:ATP-dependent helicase YprA (DUF1998 family)